MKRKFYSPPRWTYYIAIVLGLSQLVLAAGMAKIGHHWLAAGLLFFGSVLLFVNEREHS